MKKELRPYQQKGVDELRASFRSGHVSPLYILPTGGGKTFVFCYVTEGATALGRSVLILVHRKELLIQSSMSLANIGIRHRLTAQDKHVREAIGLHVEEYADSFVDMAARASIASVDTIIRRLDKMPVPDLLICDEGHHATRGNKWGVVISYFKQKNPDMRMLSVTATGNRGDGKGLGVQADGFADDVIEGPTPRELIDDGYLKQPKVFAPPSVIDLVGVRLNSEGDYNAKQLAERVDKPSITGDTVQHYARICPHWPAIAFCVSIEHAKHVAAEFCAAGFDFRVIDGTMHDAQRRNLIRALARGKIDGLTSCDIISEGTDIPIVAVGIKLRPTKSEGLNRQQDGRTLRPIYADGFDLSTRGGRLSAIAASKYPYAVILDHVGNCLIHGRPDDDMECSLDGRKKRGKGKASEKTLEVIRCDKCHQTYTTMPKDRKCTTVYPDGSKCDGKFGDNAGRQIEQQDGELVEVTDEMAAAVRVKRKQEERRATTLEDFVRIGEEREYKNPRAWAKIRMKFKRDRRQVDL